MKHLAIICISLFISTAFAQSDAPVVFSKHRLHKLLEPIALYPDPLIAIILPAASEPADIELAATYLRNNGDQSQIDAQYWSPSVRALAHYPDVLLWMNDNMDWTLTVGDAFRAQEPDVMLSIQHLRHKARRAGNLSSTTEQIIIVDDDYVRIVPAYREVIYVPVYDPYVVYYPRRHGYSGNMITFGIGWEVGVWLSFGMDWRYRHVWVGDYQPGWDYRSGYGRAWTYDGSRQRSGRTYEHHYYEPARAVPVPRTFVATTSVQQQQGHVRPGAMGRTGSPHVRTGGSAPAPAQALPPASTQRPAHPQDHGSQQRNHANPRAPSAAPTPVLNPRAADRAPNHGMDRQQQIQNQAARQRESNQVQQRQQQSQQRAQQHQEQQREQQQRQQGQQREQQQRQQNQQRAPQQQGTQRQQQGQERAQQQDRQQHQQQQAPQPREAQHPQRAQQQPPQQQRQPQGEANPRQQPPQQQRQPQGQANPHQQPPQQQRQPQGQANPHQQPSRQQAPRDKQQEPSKDRKEPKGKGRPE